METTRHRSLVERGRKKTLLETLHTHQKKQNVRNKPIVTNLKERFEHIELPAKLLDYFLRSNKSNINQSADYIEGTLIVLFSSFTKAHLSGLSFIKQTCR